MSQVLIPLFLFCKLKILGTGQNNFQSQKAARLQLEVARFQDFCSHQTASLRKFGLGGEDKHTKSKLSRERKKPQSPGADFRPRGLGKRRKQHLVLASNPQRGRDKLGCVFWNPDSGFRSARRRPSPCGPTSLLRIPGRALFPQSRRVASNRRLYNLPPHPLRALP